MTLLTMWSKLRKNKNKIKNIDITIFQYNLIKQAYCHLLKIKLTGKPMRLSHFIRSIPLKLHSVGHRNIETENKILMLC